MTRSQLIILSVLGIIILLSLVGIGILGSKLLFGDAGEGVIARGTEEGAITVPQVTPTPSSEPTATLIPAPSLTEPTQQPPASPQTPPAQAPAPGQTPLAQPLVPIQTPLIQPPAPIQTPVIQPPAPILTPLAQGVVVARQESDGPFAVAVLVGVPLQGGHHYRLEVTSRAGAVGFHGSWSQSAMGADGIPHADAKLIEGLTPASYDIVPPVTNPTLWKCSASVQNRGPGGIILTVWDVTGVK